jgi:hypothetical protein
VTGVLLPAAAVLAVAAGWAVDVAVNPRAPCRLCGGDGHHWLSRDKAWGDCRACGGTGKRLRMGARWVRPGLRGRK